VSEGSVLVRGARTDDGTVVKITPEGAGWTYIGFTAVRLAAGGTYTGQTGGDEVAIVVIAGTVTVRSAAGTWEGVGERPDPFSGRPAAVYLPAGTAYEVRAETAAEVGICAAPAREAYPARLIRPADVSEHIRGAGQATRCIHNILMEDAQAGSLLITEVQSPAGNWSSYPPHKHDQDNLPHESQLEETYYHRLRPAQGFAFQRVYTADGSLDQTVAARDGDAVLVPRGYHVVAAAAEYQVYYLNVLAGPKRALRMSFDPDHEWIMRNWTW
jgi:5-deoxy-glucuronate isomerase